MKYLFLLVRHLFPRRKWVIINEIQVYDDPSDSTTKIGKILTLRDQFGNLKTKKIKW